MRPKFWFAMALAACLTACAGTPFSMSNARLVQVGMPASQLQSIMGSSPYMVSSRGDSQVWIWSEANGFTGSHQSISFVVKDGKVVSVPTIPDSFR